MGDWRGCGLTVAERRVASRLQALVIEGDPDYRSVMAHIVDLAGGQSETVADLERGRRLLDARRFDVVIAGLAPGEDVRPEDLGDVRAAAEAPVIVLAESYEEARARYEAGVDQILPKPFVPGALVGAIKAVLRGPSVTSIVPMAEVIQVAGVTFDSQRRQVSFDDQVVSLSKREWELLSYFLANPNRYYSASTILVQVWGSDVSPEQFRTLVARIRSKLVSLNLPIELVNQPGVGYCMTFDVTPTA